MFSNTMCKSILAASIMIVAACDEMTGEQSLALDEQVEAEEAGDRQKVADAPEELEEDAAPAWSELDISDDVQGVEGPDGKTCCADCGDGWGGWYNLGGADGCNHRAAMFCGQNGWSLINAEWRYSC